ncbi:hypothetical protein LTR10_008547 [Elasticomyces elasticus]|nr:hypothetical protein LTR10_008547 [Elasticomyces elasticus]KAK4967420.1 hypothetical protein LTR42_010769 [Elasticomyces elasticus]
MLRGILFAASLLEAPTYSAVSYCWGKEDSDALIEIQIAGHPDLMIASITQTLSEALHELLRRGETLVWVDALCINQRDAFERGQQVLRMSQIYSTAHKVVAWLGRATLQSVALFHRLNNHSIAIIDRSNIDISRLTANLLARTYFRRIWIIQEIAKGREVQVWCGRDSVPWERLCALAARTDDRISAINHFRVREVQSRIGVPRMLLCEAMLRTFQCEASDQRDKVYALLGMTLDGADVVPLPDYAQPAELVLRKVTEIMIAREGLTATMLLARGRISSKAKPTWLPDWLSLPWELPPWIRNCITRERETLTFDTTISAGCLSVSGVELATFKDVCRQSAIAHDLSRYQYLNGFPITLNHDYYNPLDVLRELWDAITSHQEPSYSHADADIGRKSRAICLLYKLCESSTLHPSTLDFGMDAEGRRFGPKYPAIATEWISTTFNLRFRDRTMLGWVLNVQRRLQQDLGDPSFGASAADLEHLVACVDSLYWAGMTLAVSSTCCFWIVHRDTNVSDLVYRLVNCDLPVVLRRSGKVFRFVGEMRGPHTQAGWIVDYLKNAEWKQIVIM